LRAELGDLQTELKVLGEDRWWKEFYKKLVDISGLFLELITKLKTKGHGSLHKLK
jgi:hypothetical protein